MFIPTIHCDALPVHCHCITIGKICMVFLGPGDGMAILVQLPEGEARFVAVEPEPLGAACCKKRLCSWWCSTSPYVDSMLNSMLIPIQFDLRHVLRSFGGMSSKRRPSLETKVLCMSSRGGCRPGKAHNRTSHEVRWKQRAQGIRFQKGLCVCWVGFGWFLDCADLISGPLLIRQLGCSQWACVIQAKQTQVNTKKSCKEEI